MPNYTYVPEKGEAGCEICRAGARVTHRVSQVVKQCPFCDSRVRKSIRAADIQFQVRAKHRPDYQEYRDDMARFPGDPQAFVTTPQQVDRLKEQRQREGWVLRDEDWGDLYNTMPKHDLSEGPADPETNRALVQEAYEEAVQEVNNGGE